MEIDKMADGQMAAMGVFGKNTAEVGVATTLDGQYFYFNENGKITMGPGIDKIIRTVWLRSEWDVTGIAHFFYSTDGLNFTKTGEQFQITNFGNYLGAKIGIYTANNVVEKGFIDVDWFHYDKE
jgi:hypothetical protein